MRLKHDPEADAIYVRFSDQPVATTRTARGNTSDAAVDFAVDGSVVGVELLGVSTGIDLSNLPKADKENAGAIPQSSLHQSA